MRPVAPGLVRTPDAQARLDDLERRYGDFATFVAVRFPNPSHGGGTPTCGEAELQARRESARRGGIQTREARRDRMVKALAESMAIVEAAKARRAGT